MRAIYCEMKLSYHAMWLQFSRDVCNSFCDETQLSRDVTAVFTRCVQFIARWNSLIAPRDCSFHATCTIHRAMKLSYIARRNCSFHAMCAIHRAMKLSYLAMWLQLSCIASREAMQLPHDVCNSPRDACNLSRNVSKLSLDVSQLLRDVTHFLHNVVITNFEINGLP